MAAKKAAKKASTRTASKKTAKKAAKKSTTKKKAAKKAVKAATKSAAKKKSTTKKKSAATKDASSGTKKASAKKATTKKVTKKSSTSKNTTKKAANKTSVNKSTKKTATSQSSTAKKGGRLTKTSKKTPVKKRKLTASGVKSAMKELPKTAYTAATGTPTNEQFSKKELDKFSEMIHAIREENVQELEELSDQLREMAANEGADDNTYSLHMSEQGTDAMEREKTFLQAQRTSDYIKKLDEALLRIQHGTFGICRICGLQLDSRRLTAVPVTQVCTVYKNTSKPCQPGKHFIDTFVEDEE